MRKPTVNKSVLIAGAAAVVLIGSAGVFLALNPSPSQETQSQPGQGADDHDDHGDQAEGGEREGFVALTAQQIEAADIQIVAIGRGGGGETRLSGRVEPRVDSRAAVAAVVGGRVERVLVAPGQSIRAGQPLVSLVSGDAATLRAEADAAQAAYIAAEQAHGRDEELADLGVVSRREAEVSHAEALSAQAAAGAARARAAAAGAPSAAGRLSVTSPISGVVTSVQVGPGGFVPQGGVVAEVTNPARVELVFNAPPTLAASVRVGASLRVVGPSGEFDAVVTGVAAGAGGESGATVIRARPSGGGLPPAGSAVSGAIVTGEMQGGLTVPTEAIQTVEGATVVFVQVAGGFQATPVLVGRQASGRTEILRGLNGGERVAGTGAFLLKAELAKGEAEHGH